MRILIRGGRIIDPRSGMDRTGDLAVSDGHVAHCGDVPDTFAADEIFEAAGHIVCPGLIDLGARLGRPGPEHPDTIAGEAHAAAAGGITTLVCPPDTDPLIDAPPVAELIHRRAAEAGGARVLPVGALTRGLAGEQLAEMATLRAAGCPAVGDGGHPVADTLVLRRALAYAATFGLPAMITPLDPYLGTAGCAHEGAVATRLGLPGIPTAAETAGIARCLALAAEGEADVHFSHLSTAEALTLLRQARADGARVSADVTLAQLFFTEQDLTGYDARFNLRPPLRTLADREALRRAVATGDIGVICSGHHPLGGDAKDGPFATTSPGASGVDTFLPLLLRLVETEVLPLPEAIARATSGPASVLGLDTGTLAPGAPADICVFDPDAVWWCRRETLRSRGRNSPFLGWEMTGRVRYTLVDGRLVHRDDAATA
ncbi:Dihydroorotase-like protein [wastewater metagenome]|uniref:Dihydroorotase-like protein n=2 Tax=unclassified sequences TaxID=12908 RepID=A0A5B8RFA7_9ZZZZ|nr:MULTISPECIES: dihydroorotase [Arhodomonas]MCS4505566.1 dihydroorotase [Arhodomonas aquaeolei]QEA07266.1 dihydroorotase-like protein [uncultured organism]